MEFDGNWTVDSANSFREECLKISKDLTGFKRNPTYIKIIGNDLRDETVTKKFYQYLKDNHTQLISKIDVFKTNDEIGDPNLFEVEDGIIVSPGTLRFMKVLGDIIPLQPKSIVEIGSGYGGQAKIITDYIDLKYTLIDIPESLEVAKSYLKHFKKEFTFVSSEDILLKSYDLVISDYCLSEFDSKGIDFYLENVIKYCRYGYFTINSQGSSREYLLSQLRKYFDLSIKSEVPNPSPIHSNLIVIAKNKSSNS